MPMPNPFEADGFTLAELTAAINALPFQPRRISASGLFSEDSVSTTDVLVESVGGVLSLVPNLPRGAPATPKGRDKSTLRTFRTTHLPQRGTVYADSVQNVREFGSDGQAANLQTEVNKLLAKMRRDLDVTIEFHRAGALNGLILDASGSTIVNLFDEFGVVQQTHPLSLGSSTAPILQEVIQAKRKSEDELGGDEVTEWRAYCGREFFEALTANSKVESAFERWADGDFLRTDNRKGFPFGGVEWVEYRGKVSGRDFIPADAGFLVPVGVPDLFITRFAPADYVETVNTLGFPYYAKAVQDQFGKAMFLEAQSNPINLCTRPRAVIKLTIGG